MPTGTIQAGASQVVTLGTNTGKLRTVVTLSGRSSGRVFITAKEAGASAASAPVGADNEINMAIESTIVITGASVDEVVIDDTQNRGNAPITYTVTQYAS